MIYQILEYSRDYYTYVDEKTRNMVLDAFITDGEKTEERVNKIIKIIPDEKVTISSFLPFDGPDEYFGIGSTRYISKKVKDIFERHGVAGEFFEAQLFFEGKPYQEAYYAFNPLLTIDCIDYDNSAYLKKYDKWSKEFSISEFTHLSILSDRIPDKSPLFFPSDIKKKNMRVMGFTLLINESLAKALKAGNVRGLNVFDIENFQWNWWLIDR